jgi:ribosomal protein S15P/S13E
MTLFIVIYGITFYDEAIEDEPILGSNDKVNPLDINDVTSIVPQELTQNIKYEAATINTEINRTNDIFKSATLTISDSFKHLKELSDNQSRMIETLIHSIKNTTIELTSICTQLNSFGLNTSKITDQDIDDNTQALILNEFNENINVMTTRITQLHSHAEQSTKDLLDITQQQNEAVYTGVRALQFEDLTSQVLSSIKQNTQTIAVLSNDIPVLCAYLTKKELNNLTVLKQKIIDINTESKQRNNTKSVEQTSMEEGEVELF